MKRSPFIPICLIILLCLVIALSCKDDKESVLPEILTITPQINHINAIYLSKLSPDGKYMATTDYIHIIIKGKARNTVFHRFKIPPTLIGEKVKSMAFSKENSSLIAYINDYKLEYSLKTSSLIDMIEYNGKIPVDNGKGLLEIITPQSKITTLSISSDKKYISIVDNDGWIKIWEVFSAKILTSIFNEGESIIAIYLNPYQQKIQAVSCSATYYEWDISDIDYPKLTKEIKIPSINRQVSFVSFSGSGKRIFIVENNEQSSSLVLLKNQDDRIIEKSRKILNGPIMYVDINYDGQSIAIIQCDNNSSRTGIIMLDENLIQKGFIETEHIPSQINFGDDGYLTALFKNSESIRQYHLTGEHITLPFKSNYPISLFDYCDNIYIMVNIYGELIFINSYNPDNSFNLTFGGKDYYLYSTIDGVFTASSISMIRGVKWLDIAPQTQWIGLYDHDEIEGRLVEYMGLVSDW